jgi:hypothetical protein
MHSSIPELLVLVDDYQRTDAFALIDAMAEELAHDHEQTIATMREIARETIAKYEEEYAVRALWIAFGVSSGADTEEIAVELANALGRERDDEGFARLHDELARRYASDPAAELCVRLAIGSKLTSLSERAFIVRNLRAAEALATSDRERLVLATALLAHVASIGRGARDAAARNRAATYLREVGVELDGALARCAALANTLAADASARDAVIRADIEISRADPVLAHRHASRAFELAHAAAARPSAAPQPSAASRPAASQLSAPSAASRPWRAIDRHLREAAVTGFAELLLDADLLERADEVASTLEVDIVSKVGSLELVKEPGDDEGDEGAWAVHGIGALALLEDIRRRRGVLAEPPPEAFVPPPIDPAGASQMALANPTLPEGLVEYFTRDPEPSTAIPRVVSPEKVREWSHGQVSTIRELQSQKIFGPARSYACGCGRFVGVKYRGVVCHRCGVEVIDRVARTHRTGHIVLPEPVIHPWHASTIAALLGRGVRETQNANANELIEQLRPLDYDMHRLAYEIEDRRPNDPRLAVIKAVMDSYIKPTWFVLEMVPVWPPDATVLGDREAVSRAYMEVLDGVDLCTAVNRLFSTITKQITT